MGCAAQASTVYDFQYTFASTGDVVTGSFSGNASGDLITNLSNIAVSVDGVAFNGSGSLFGSSYVDALGNAQPGGAIVSFDGLQNNFIFADSNFPLDPNYTNVFSAESLTDPTVGLALTATTGTFDVPFVAANWSVTQVPEPATLSLMGLGLAAVGIARRRRKNGGSPA